MPTNKFKIHVRLLEFWNRIISADSYSFAQLFYFLGWIIVFGFFCLSWKSGFGNYTPMVLILAFFWYRFDESFLEKMRVPVEIWIFSFFLLGTLDYLWISIFIEFNTITPFSVSEPTVVSTLLQIILLSCLTLILSFILTRDKAKRWISFLFYMLLLIIGIKLLVFSDPILWLIIQVLLVLILLRYTSWIESLTKTENWLYFTVTLILYLSVFTLPEISNTDFSLYSLSWYYFPKILAHFFKLYLLAVLLKIPFVLVYHHASLKRKFQIAGWLQSSIPQFIQLIILILVFYFFISSWQADNLRNTLFNYVNIDKNNPHSTSHLVHTFLPNEESKSYKIPGYDPFVLPESLPGAGVLQLSKADPESTSEHSYFFIFQTEKDSVSQLHLITIDTLFLRDLNKGLSHFISNGLLAYPFTLQNWDSNFYKIRIWQVEQGYKSLNTFPFALIPRKSEQFKTEHFSANAMDPAGKSSWSRIKIMNQDIFTAGRLYTNLYDRDFKQRGYYAIDVVIFLTWDFFKSTLMKLLIFWLIVYFLINLLIIQRVAKFGNQITQKIIQKFNQLTQGIRQVSGGNLDYKIEMEGEDEFVELAERFNQMGSELHRNISELREKDRLEHELRIARDVQLGLLPKTLPQIDGYQVAAHINTATEVGGDFYDMIPLSPEKYLFVVGDVSGKGTSAAFYMAQCISLIRFACQFSDKPQEIILRLNRYFSDPLIDRQIFVTAVLGVLDSHKNQITFLRAGHNHPILISGRGEVPIKEIKTPGIGIGLERKGHVFEKILKGKAVRLGKGDGLFLYTDGLVEASSYSDKMITDPKKVTFFGEENLIQIIDKSRERTALEMIQTINTNIRQFYGKSPLIDDLTMLLIRRNRD